MTDPAHIKELEYILKTSASAKDIPYILGRIACAKGKRISTCPYPVTSTFGIMWGAGFCDERANVRMPS